jgi:DNA modification methylase
MKERASRTTTSAFGVGRRESHDASGFYARFEPPEMSVDDAVEPLKDLPQGAAACIKADSRRLKLPGGGRLPANSVALVVTSPPYFSGKEYEQALGRGHIPGSYLEYLGMLRDVFAECKRVLEPGGRIAVNVANLGRKPYRSLAADIVRVLQDDLRLLLRGEVIWRKGEGASSSCAWGSFRSAANPVLRDVTERVIIASKGRFDRAISVERRRQLSLPHTSEISTDEFMEATLDVWNMAPESATRVGHPAPFPVELPQRLIGLYTFRDDLVLDPFMGSGTTLVAAICSGRRYLGYETDAGYVATAKRRVTEELGRRVPRAAPGRGRRAPGPAGEGTSVPRGGHKAEAGPAKARNAVQAMAEDVVVAAGFCMTRRGARLRGLGVAVSLVASDVDGAPWYFDVSGAFTVTKSGLARTDTLLKALGRANVMANNAKSPLVLLTSSLPRAGSDGDLALRAVGPGVIFDVIELAAEDQVARLKIYAEGGRSRGPEPGFWAERDIAKLVAGTEAAQ